MQTDSTDTRQLPLVAFLTSAIAWISMWTVMAVSPWIIRSGIRQGEHEEAFTLPILLWVTVSALNIAAVILGYIATRRQTRSSLGVAAIAVGVTGLLGPAIYYIATRAILPHIM